MTVMFFVYLKDALKLNGDSATEVPVVVDPVSVLAHLFKSANNFLCLSYDESISQENSSVGSKQMLDEFLRGISYRQTFMSCAVHCIKIEATSKRWSEVHVRMYNGSEIEVLLWLSTS